MNARQQMKIVKIKVYSCTSDLRVRVLKQYTCKGVGRNISGGGEGGQRKTD